MKALSRSIGRSILPLTAPIFSVIIPTRNRPALLARALRSALAQRGPSFEILVADDGNGDGVRTAIEIAGDTVQAFRTGEVGQVPTRNMAVQRARGRRIAFLDDDDWWAADDYLAALAGTLDGGAAFAYASGRMVRETDGHATGEMTFRAHVDARSIRQDNTLLVSGLAYEAALHRTLGPFDETMPVYWDWDWYLRLATAGTRMADTGSDAVRISVRGDSVSAPANEAIRQAELKRLCDKHGLTGVVLKNHESIAVEQAAGPAVAS